MATSDYTLNLLKNFEGYTAKPKWDEKQYSVGYSTKWEPGQPIGTREDHERALADEAGKIDSYIDQNVRVPLNDNQRAALTSFGFNLGPGAVQKLLPDINAGDWDKVANRMLSFSRAGDNPNALVDRRRQEAGILLGAPLPDSASQNATSSPASSPSAPSAKQEGGVFDLSSIMANLGKGFTGQGGGPSTGSAGQGNIFGSLGSAFTGQNQQSQGQQQNAAANMSLAQSAQKSVFDEDEKKKSGAAEEQMPTYQKRPVDLAALSKILQQRSQLGAIGAGRQPGFGLGA